MFVCMCTLAEQWACAFVFVCSCHAFDANYHFIYGELTLLLSFLSFCLLILSFIYCALHSRMKQIKKVLRRDSKFFLFFFFVIAVGGMPCSCVLREQWAHCPIEMASSTLWSMSWMGCGVWCTTVSGVHVRTKHKSMFDIDILWNVKLELVLYIPFTTTVSMALPNYLSPSSLSSPSSSFIRSHLIRSLFRCYVCARVFDLYQSTELIVRRRRQRQRREIVRFSVDFFLLPHRIIHLTLPRIR